MDLRVARRYALALFSAAQQAGAVEETAQDLDAIAVVLKGNEEAKEFLESPEVDRNAKLQFVDKVFSTAGPVMGTSFAPQEVVGSWMLAEGWPTP